MEATRPQIIAGFTRPAEEGDFPPGGALLPPAGHGAKHNRGPAAPGLFQKCQERSSDPFCSTGQNCSHSPYTTTCCVQKQPGRAEGQECDDGRGAFTAGWISTTPEGPEKGLHPTVVHLKDASFHNKRMQNDSSLNPFVQLSSAPWGVFVELRQFG